MAFVALGANLGDAGAVLRRAMEQLEALSRGPVRRSSLWRSAPVDCPPGSPDFLNAVVALTPLAGETPESLLQRLQDLERTFGRRPKQMVNEPRPLDLDLLVFGAELRSTPELTLPHPRAHRRRFVLEPLCELAPDYVLPGQDLSVRDLLARLGTNQSIRRVVG